MGYVLLQRKKGSLKKNNFVLFSYKKSTILSLACSTRVDYILSISKNITVAGDNFAGAGQTWPIQQQMDVLTMGRSWWITTDPQKEPWNLHYCYEHEWHSKSTISFYPTQVKNMNSQAKRNLKRIHLIWKTKISNLSSNSFI